MNPSVQKIKDIMKNKSRLSLTELIYLDKATKEQLKLVRETSNKLKQITDDAPPRILEQPRGVSED